MKCLTQSELEFMEQRTRRSRFRILAFGTNPSADLFTIMVASMIAIATLVAFFPFFDPIGILHLSSVENFSVNSSIFNPLNIILRAFYSVHYRYTKKISIIKHLILKKYYVLIS